MEYGIIIKVNKVEGFALGNMAKFTGKNNSQLGISSMLGFFGGRTMDGYEVETNLHKIRVLIDNSQSCCESWGYIQSEDDLTPYIGSELIDINLTDTANNVEMLKNESLEYGFDRGGIQFVDFATRKGTFQLAVYNAHNGYYGHGIIIAVDDDIIHDDTL